MGGAILHFCCLTGKMQHKCCCLLFSKAVRHLVFAPALDLRWLLDRFILPNVSRAGQRRPGLCKHFRPVKHEHAKGPRVSAVRRPGEPVGMFSFHRLQPLRRRAGVQSPQIHPSRLDLTSATTEIFPLTLQSAPSQTMLCWLAFQSPVQPSPLQKEGSVPLNSLSWRASKSDGQVCMLGFTCSGSAAGANPPDYPCLAQVTARDWEAGFPLQLVSIRHGGSCASQGKLLTMWQLDGFCKLVRHSS